VQMYKTRKHMKAPLRTKTKTPNQAGQREGNQV
jgi:hypothetical protein